MEEPPPEKPSLRSSVERFMVLGAALGALASLSAMAPALQAGENTMRIAWRLLGGALLGGGIGTLIGWIRFKIRGGNQS